MKIKFARYAKNAWVVLVTSQLQKSCVNTEKKEVLVNDCPAFYDGRCYVWVNLDHYSKPGICANYSGTYRVLQRGHRFFMVCSKGIFSDIKENFPDIHRRLYNHLNERADKNKIIKLAREIPIRSMKNHKETIEHIIGSNAEEKIVQLRDDLVMLINASSG